MLLSDIIRENQFNSQEKNQAKNKLIENDKKYRLLAGKITEVIWALDLKKFQFDYVSPLVEQIVGYTPEEVVGIPLERFVRPDSMENVRELFHRRYQKTLLSPCIKPQTLDIGVYHKSGKTVWLEASARFYRNENDEAVGIVGVARDCTKRKQTEEKLRRSYDEIENQVNERTADLKKSQQELQDANTILKLLLEKKDENKLLFEKTVVSNVKELVQPIISKLSQSNLNEKQREYLDLLSENLNQITKPFLRKSPLQYANLTPTEVQIAGMIKYGKTTKEISALMNIGISTVDFHRNNIRKKLELKKKKVNLQIYLRSQEFGL